MATKKKISDLKSRLKQKDEISKSTITDIASETSSVSQDEIDSLNKKIDKLTKDLVAVEDERDDYEDEAKSAKKKLKSKTEEYSRLSAEMSEMTRNMDTLKCDYENVSVELEEQRVLLKEQKESLDFVNAILEAKEASDEFTKSRNEAIDNVRNILLNYCDSLSYHGLGENREKFSYLASQWANEQKKPWIKRKKVIALIGEFSAGKTSIVNRILSQDNPKAPQLPTNSKATTAIPTYISYGPSFLSQFLDANGVLKNIKKEDFERVKKDVLKKVKVSSLLQYFVMSYDNKNLEGLTILDTPGFSSNDPEDERRTCDVINEADALFWVFDVNQAFNKTSINIIKANIKDVPLFIIMNKCDQLSPNEQNAKEDNLRKTLKKADIPIKGVLRFSEKCDIDVLMNAIFSIESKKEDDVITYILEDLYALYDSINNEYKKCQEALVTQKRDLETIEENIQYFLNQYQEDADAIDKMPELNCHFFSRNCYEISIEDYWDLKIKCQNMIGNREPFENEINDLKEYSENITKSEKCFNDLKLQRKMLQDYEKKIIGSIKKFDSNLYIPAHVSSSNKKNS